MDPTVASSPSADSSRRGRPNEQTHPPLLRWPGSAATFPPSSTATTTTWAPLLREEVRSPAIIAARRGTDRARPACSRSRIASSSRSTIRSASDDHAVILAREAGSSATGGPRRRIACSSTTSARQAGRGMDLRRGPARARRALVVRGRRRDAARMEARRLARHAVMTSSRPSRFSPPAGALRRSPACRERAAGLPGVPSRCSCGSSGWPTCGCRIRTCGALFIAVRAAASCPFVICCMVRAGGTVSLRGLLLGSGDLVFALLFATWLSGAQRSPSRTRARVGATGTVSFLPRFTHRPPLNA